MNELDLPFIQTFLGTGAGDFYEVHVCKCDDNSCRKAKELGGKNIRHASSVFITPNILVDFYNPEQLLRQKIPPNAVNHLLITHGHYDHFQPQAILDYAAGLDQPLDIYGSVSIQLALDFITKNAWNPDQGDFVIRNDTSNIRMHTIESGQTFDVGETTVTAVLANHMIDKSNLILEQPALNYVFERNGKTLFYGLDSSYILPESFEILSRFQFDAIVLDGTFGYRDTDPAVSGHHNFAMLEKTISSFRDANLLKANAKVIASHISCHHVPPHDEIAEGLMQHNIILAYDGMRLEL